jgi:chromosome segregation ATPase
MEPATLISLGALLIAGVAMTINLYKAFRESKVEDFRSSAEYIRARTETELGSVEAAERIIVMYSSALEKMQKELDVQRGEIADLRLELSQLQISLQTKDVEIAILKTQLGAK